MACCRIQGLYLIHDKKWQKKEKTPENVQSTFYHLTRTNLHELLDEPEWFTSSDNFTLVSKIVNTDKREKGKLLSRSLAKLKTQKSRN